MWKRVTGEQIAVGNTTARFTTPEYFTGLKADTTHTAGRKMVGIANREPGRTPKIIEQFLL